MTARLRRLSADYQRVLEAFARHPHIRLLEAQGTPPERYRFELRVTGLVPSGEASFIERNEHRVEIFLPLDYPRRPPICRMLTAVFHPNIDPQKICLGDHWSAGQSLAEMVVRVAEMISYQSYNTKSPLNAKAAAWAEQNVALLPLHKGDLSSGW
ncbi:MAG: hypothetical protein HY744_34675 [Deltaproteobacteria bacterium]|nr:hypothetical protein [Deltaproteobacteria bacterium]